LVLAAPAAERRMSSMGKGWRMLAVGAAGGVLLVGWSLLRVASDGVAPSNCGISSVRDLAYVLNRPVPDAVGAEVERAYPGPQISLLDVREMAARLGIELTRVRASLDDLSARRLPAIIHLRNPNHFVVLTRLSPEWVQVMDRGGLLARAREAFEKRFTGHALILKRPDSPPTGPRLELPAFHYQFGVTGPGQKVSQDFVCRNPGDRDLHIKTQATPG
jgi:Peptidase C39 family